MESCSPQSGIMQSAASGDRLRDPVQLWLACPADNLLEAGGPLPGIIRALSSLEDPRGVQEKFFDSSMEQPLEQEGAVVQQGEAAVQGSCTQCTPPAAGCICQQGQGWLH